MKGIVAQLVGFTLFAFVMVGFVRDARAEETTGDVASKVLDAADRMNGGTPDSPLEKQLRGKLEELSEMEQGASGGFEPPPEDTSTPPAENDAQYNALKELLQKMTPLERVKAGVWYLVIQPRTPHRDEVTRMIDQQAAMLTGPESGDFRDYMGVRKSLAGSSYDARIDRWTEYGKQKPTSAFADLAKREVQHLESLKRDKAEERKSGAGKFLAKLGIVFVVLALLVVIVFGAAK